MSLTLRERQRLRRHEKILGVARRRFQSDGYANVTIEEIAAATEVSAVTVYNYFGSKAGLLLALVSESDTRLLEKLDEMIARRLPSLPDAVLEFGSILRDHAMSYLEKPTWREVLAASVQDGSGRFGKTYAALDRLLVDKMAEMIREFQTRGLVSCELDPQSLADCLFSLQNMRFFQFIADDYLDSETVSLMLSNDLEALGQLFGADRE